MARRRCFHLRSRQSERYAPLSIKMNLVSQKFELFPQLPAEIRLQVWEHALPGPRILLVDTNSMRLIASKPDRISLLSVNHESRALFLSKFTKSANRLPFYYNLSVDTVYLTELTQTQYRRSDGWPPREMFKIEFPDTFLKAVKYLAVDLSCKRDSNITKLTAQDMMNTFSCGFEYIREIASFPGVEEVSFVQRDPCYECPAPEVCSLDHENGATHGQRLLNDSIFFVLPRFKPIQPTRMSLERIISSMESLKIDYCKEIAAEFTPLPESANTQGPAEESDEQVQLRTPPASISDLLILEQGLRHFFSPALLEDLPTVSTPLTKRVRHAFRRFAANKKAKANRTGIPEIRVVRVCFPTKLEASYGNRYSFNQVPNNSDDEGGDGDDQDEEENWTDAMFMTRYIDRCLGNRDWLEPYMKERGLEYDETLHG